jgi:5-(aminomethyl)-3-furanmethanol phosphate kinase
MGSVISVIKIGGGLAEMPGALDQVCKAVGEAARGRKVLVVPGGGPFAEVVRELDRTVGLSPNAAHWMAILGMDQYAYALVEKIPGALLVDEPGVIVETLRLGSVVVLAPFRWMRSADVLPHSWEATSDSVAAFVAGAVDAERLILIKPVAESPDQVDPYFLTALPRGLAYSIVGCDRLDELPRRLSE